MGRAVLIALAVAFLTGCGSLISSGTDGSPSVPQPDAGRGPIDDRARSLPATRTCDGANPPVPLIRATRTSDRIRIEYELLARPGACRPKAILITANSVDKLDNMAPGANNGDPMRLTDDEGVVELKLPPLDLPPYEARASTLTSLGRRSETTTVPVPESGDYCRRTQGAEVCIARAQAKFMRCLRGQARREDCPDYVWGARRLLPYEPLRGVTRKGLERSFGYMARRGGVEFVSVECSSLRECVGTWRGYGGIFRARYEVTGYGADTGCWNAERRAILAEITPPKGMAPLRHIVSDRQSACVHWVR